METDQSEKNSSAPLLIILVLFNITSVVLIVFMAVLIIYMADGGSGIFVYFLSFAFPVFSLLSVAFTWIFYSKGQSEYAAFVSISPIVLFFLILMINK